ncbi:unnamed protein product [Lasius platythorax]|uniref:Homeobox domain-containing protein n=1 Tax=Lasius platythorax TaxID=488582 RepID=A0AAV2N079_9HYME
MSFLEKAQEHESDSEPSINTDQQDDSALNSSKNVHNTESSNVDDFMNFSARKENDSSLVSSSGDERVLRRKRKISSGSKFELQKSKKIDEVDTLTDNYQDSSLELSHSRKRKRLNDNKEYSRIEKKTKRHWTKEEIQSAGRYFDDYVENGVLPSLPKIKEIQRDYNILQSRTPAVVKTWLHNQIRNAKKRKSTSPSVKKVRAKKSPSKKHLKKHMAYIFTSHLTKRRAPTIDECREVTKRNKTFTKILPK